MANDTTDTISVLNDLIETCRDGIDGFRQAADSVTNPEAKTLFMSRIPTIEKSASELQAAVRKLGGEAATTGSTAAAVHRGWIGLKAAVTGKDDAAITTECERGEQLAVKHYEDALKHALPNEIRSMVESQHRGTLQNLARVRSLGGSVGASTPTIAPKPESAAPGAPSTM